MAAKRLALGGKLNLFQRTMLRWKALHPYNAVHVLGIAGPVDEPRLREAIAGQLEAWGLTGLEVRDGRYRYRGGPAVVALDVLAERSVAEALERELNEPFAPGPAMEPFRFFVIPEPGGFRLGLAYDHFVAGGDSIVVLLASIARRYLDPAAAPLQTPPALYPPTYRNLFLRQPLVLLRAMASLPAMISEARRCVRPHYQDDHDGASGFAYFRVGPREARALLATGKSWGVTLNDLLLAMLLQALAPMAPARAEADRRNRLAVATIVNARRDFGFGTETVFGQFLASMRISHRVPVEMPLRTLAEEIHRATASVKGGKHYLRTLPALGLMTLLWPLLTERRRARIYTKGYPVWGGVTSLNVNALWPGGGGRSPTPEYLRGVPTGPLSPLVLAVTTTAEVMNIGVTFRRTAFSRDAVEAVTSRLRGSIESLPA